jgi:hypothetical membrane protein
MVGISSNGAPPSRGGRAILATTRGAVFWVVAAIGYLVLEAAAAAGFEPGYSYAHNYISDLGVSYSRPVDGRIVSSPRAYLIHAAFYLQGILFLLGAALIARSPDSRRSRLFLGTVAANAVGNIVIGTVHSGSLHIAGAVLAIVGGNAAILTGATASQVLAGLRWYRRVSTAVALLGLSAMTMLVFNSVTGQKHLLPDGVWERTSVYSITGWQLLTATCLLTNRRREPV